MSGGFFTFLARGVFSLPPPGPLGWGAGEVIRLADLGPDLGPDLSALACSLINKEKTTMLVHVLFIFNSFVLFLHANGL